MVEIAWLPSFETGLPEIDNDHRKLVNSIRHIEVALKGGDFKKCATLFADFMQQAKDHFKREEAFLISIDFPRLESHRSAHQRLLDMADKTLATVSEDLDRDEATKMPGRNDLFSPGRCHPGRFGFQILCPGTWLDLTSKIRPFSRKALPHKSRSG